MREKSAVVRRMVLLSLLFVLGGMVAMRLTDGYALRLDLTENRLYTLSDETRAVLSAVEEPVDVTVLAGEAQAPLLLRGMLASYAEVGERLTIRYLDPVLYPSRIEEMEARGAVLEEDCIVVSSARGIRVIGLDECYELSEDGTKVTAIRAESEITSAIFQVSVARHKQAILSDGHGERTSAALRTLLEQNDFETKATAIGVLGIPEETDLIVLAAPESDLSAPEAEMLSGYLQSGGRMLVLLEPGMQTLVNLSDLLAVWGIDVGADTVREPSLYVSGNPENVVAAYGQHPINVPFAGRRIFTVMPACIPLAQRFVRSGEIVTRQVLFSSTQSIVTHGARQEKGPFTLAMTAERRNTMESETRMLVSGSRLSVADEVLENNMLANRTFYAQCLAWLTDEETIAIPAKNLQDPYLAADHGMSVRIGIFFMGIIPAILITVGLIDALRRRRS